MSGETITVKHCGRGRRYIPAINLPDGRSGEPRTFERCISGDGGPALEAYILEVPTGVVASCKHPDGSTSRLDANTLAEKHVLIAKLRSGCWSADGETITILPRSEAATAGQLGQILEPGETLVIRADRAAQILGDGIMALDAQGNLIDPAVAKAMRQHAARMTPGQMAEWEQLCKKGHSGETAEAIVADRAERPADAPAGAPRGKPGKAK